MRSHHNHQTMKVKRESLLHDEEHHIPYHCSAYHYSTFCCSTFATKPATTQLAVAAQSATARPPVAAQPTVADSCSNHLEGCVGSSVYIAVDVESRLPPSTYLVQPIRLSRSASQSPP